ncbi:MAG: carbohydrate ABC transporter substrate-binding protein [Hyphomicrobiales bacterium]|nr:ABC transporter substrate-binding protein [Hyphomicrobiales bacterium]MDE2016306.1 carbohydrate ABC transporter substrate-binding protein [Hyphomicrobiales bacterium]
MAFVATAALAVGAARAADPNSVEVIHWWTSGGEAAAVKVFADAFDKAGGKWIDAAIANGDQARAAGINRIIGGNPPGMMQFNTGKQLDELVKGGYLDTLDALAKAGNWAAVLPKSIAAASMRDGHWYALPVNIHGQGWMFYSVKAFKDAGVEPPKTWADVLADAPKLKAKGIIPIAQGGQPWQEHILFDDVLAGQGGSDMFLKVYGDKKTAAAAVADPKFKAVAETFKKLKDFMDPGEAGRNWNDATAMVITGKAGMQMMGDWAKGEFSHANQTAGKDYGCVPISGGYIIGGDVFVFPKQAGASDLSAGQKLLAETMFSPAIQLAFNKVKGSIPVRTDVDTSSMDTCAQQGAALMKDPSKQLPSLNYLISPDEAGALDDVITKYFNTPDETADQFVQKFADAIKNSA